jgi:hypothetical protein
MLRTCTLFGLLAAPFALAAPVPAPKEVKPTVATLRAALGKNFLGKELRAREMGAAPTFEAASVLGDAKNERTEDDTAFLLRWKERGLELHIDEGKLQAAYLHNADVDGYKQYPGELPGGLTFADEPEAVEKKLGKPEEREELEGARKVGGKRQDELWYQYPSAGVWVVFWRIAGQPYSIRFVSVYPPVKG